MNAGKVILGLLALNAFGGGAKARRRAERISGDDDHHGAHGGRHIKMTSKSSPSHKEGFGRMARIRYGGKGMEMPGERPDDDDPARPQDQRGATPQQPRGAPYGADYGDQEYGDDELRQLSADQYAAIWDWYGQG